MQRILLGISCGDPNGIGLEVALKTFSDVRTFNYFSPVIFASTEMVEAHLYANDLKPLHIRSIGLDNLAKVRDEEHEDDDTLWVVECWEHEYPVEFGRLSEEGGAVAKTSLELAAKAMHEGFIDALVTAPIHKSAMQQAGFGFPGHTEYLESEFSQSKSLMLMVGDNGLRVAVATGHIPLKNVANSISPTIIQNKIGLFNDTLIRDFGITGPMIAVLGLNPHAGDGGAIGSEEEITIRPAIEVMKERGVDVMGPYPADGFFGSGEYRKFDGILAMYHDQGLVPFKTLAFGGGVNFTAGLKIVRTSPDHGTALDIAGKGLASPASFTEACFLARDIFLKRNGFDEAHANPMRIRKYSKHKGNRQDNDRPFHDPSDDYPKASNKGGAKKKSSGDEKQNASRGAKRSDAGKTREEE